MIDPTITTGNIIEATAFILGVVAFLFKRDNTISNITKELREMQLEIKKLAVVVTGQALAELKITNVEQDIREIRHDLREMRHGRGFVQGERGIDKEWETK